MTTRCAICGIPRADHGYTAVAGNAALRRYQPPGDSRHQIDVLTGRPLSDEDNQ